MKYISIYQKEKYIYKHENVNGFQTATFKFVTFHQDSKLWKT